MIEVKNISKTYHLGSVGVRALAGVSFTISPAEYVAIIGPSGSGKSTLMHVLGLLDRPDSGSYRLCGREVTGLSDDELAYLRNRLIGFVFQDFYLLSSLDALKNAELPLIYAGRGADRVKAKEKIAVVGLSPRASHRPSELSGGEQQRVAVARSLVNEPLILLADEPTGNLDSKSAAGIISLLEDLHRQGKTVIMVTHNLEIAERAERVITMRDGIIVSDRRTAAARPDERPEEAAACPDDIIARSRASGRSAVFGDHVRQAVRSLTTHKMRAVLSMLGIMIGVGAVIAMLALGQGAKDSIAERLASLGSNLLMVRLRPPQVGGVRLESGSRPRLTNQDAAQVAKLPQVEMVSPGVSGRGQIVYGGKNWNTQIQGTGVSYAPMRASVPVIGRFFTEEEVRRRDKVAVIGATIARELWGEDNPVGSTVKINRVNFLVIGVLPTKGAGGWRDQDDVVIIPISTAMHRLLGKDYVDSIDVQVKDAALLEEAQGEITALLAKEHRIQAGQEEAVDIRNMADIQETLQATTQTMSWLLGSIAAISLLVGGIGIMNIMLVSVTERTREIGLRKAVGARRRDILLQFLIEAVLMTVSGGALGLLLGAGVAVLMAKVAEWSVRITPYSIVLATTFSAAVGLIFGVFPARKAAGLDPIEALRYE